MTLSSVGKESSCNAGDTGVKDLIPGWGRCDITESFCGLGCHRSPNKDV